MAPSNESSFDRETVRLVEELAANAWPASVVQVVDGWRLRATPRVEARRSNSALPNGDDGGVPLENRLAMVDDFYRRRGLPVRFQMSPAALPLGLDGMLADRGFGVEVEVDVQVAGLDEVSARAARGGHRVEVADRPDDRWLRTLVAVNPRGDPEILRHTILDRIGPPAAYAAVVRNGRAVAVGMGVTERRWMGLFSMDTLPEARRQGAATALLHDLAAWGKRLGASRAYLQVERSNDAAHALYERAGFTTAYGYHYRTRA